MLCRSTNWTAICLLVLAGTSSAEQPVELMEGVQRVKVISAGRLPDECLAPVQITRIDGLRQAMPARGFMLEPGVHRLNGKAILDTARCWPLDKDQRIPPAADLEVDFEPGKVYYIAYDRSHPDVNRWQLVVWKVEQAPLSGADSGDVETLPEADTDQ